MSVSRMCICTVALVAVSGATTADTHGFRKRFPESASPEYHELVLHMRERASAYDKPLGRQFFRRIVDSILEPNAVEISFRYKIESNEKESNIVVSGKMYFSGGEFFVRSRIVDTHLYARLFRSNEHFDYSLSDYATIGGSLYQWSVTTKNANGKRLQRYHGDTIDLIMYRVDPAGMMKDVYRDYVAYGTETERAELFVLRKLADNRIEVLNKYEDRPPTNGIRVSEDPPWFHAAVWETPLRGADRSTQYIYEIDYPKVLDKIPEVVRRLPEDLDFADSSETVENSMYE
ncbi:MAG: hypothetical protein IIC50_08055 [Planctomycetes bacterium]|nr:hypothetical protein [Planctomycetota bacterium]